MLFTACAAHRSQLLVRPSFLSSHQRWPQPRKLLLCSPARRRRRPSPPPFVFKVDCILWQTTSMTSTHTRVSLWGRVDLLANKKKIKKNIGRMSESSHCMEIQSKLLQHTCKWSTEDINNHQHEVLHIPNGVNKSVNPSTLWHSSNIPKFFFFSPLPRRFHPVIPH